MLGKIVLFVAFSALALMFAGMLTYKPSWNNKQGVEIIEMVDLPGENGAAMQVENDGE